jgi:mannosylglycoprotein endo-beta-mannosidase
MIICSFNVRGLGSRVKRNKVRELVRNYKVDFLALQETKMEEISAGVVQSLWGSEDCVWVSLPSIGNSGGILSVWDNRKFSLFLMKVLQGSVCW